MKYAYHVPYILSGGSVDVSAGAVTLWVDFPEVTSTNHTIILQDAIRKVNQLSQSTTVIILSWNRLPADDREDSGPSNVKTFKPRS